VEPDNKDMADTATVTEWDAQGNPVTPQAATAPREWDAAGNPIGPSTPSARPTAAPAPQETPFSGFGGGTTRGVGAGGSWDSALEQLGTLASHEIFDKPVEAVKLWKALIHAKMTGADPSLVFQHANQVEEHFRSIASDYDAQATKAAKSGVEETPLAMVIRGKSPEPFESSDVLLNLIHDISNIYTDPTFLLPMGVGKALGFAKAGVLGGFALSSGLRRTLMDHYQKGDIKSFGDLTSRAASIVEDATKGAIQGEVMMLAGDIPVGKYIARSPIGATLLKGLYQSAALTLTGAALDEQVPTVSQFERNAVMVGAVGLVTHGIDINTKQGLMDVYAKNGTPPEQTVTKLQAQPPVKPESKPGLQPAIRITAKDGSKPIITGEDATHSDLAERVTGDRPVSIDELNADPKIADRVLKQPEIQVQQVIDRAMELKGESGDAEQLPEAPKSGRGFAMVRGGTTIAYMNRKQAANWVKANEPEVYDMWKQEHPEDGAEFHSQDYMDAHKRVADRNVMEGEPKLNGVSQELQEGLAKNRAKLNEIKASDTMSADYAEALRNTRTGTKNMIHAFGEQFAGRLDKLLPDSRQIEREAVGFMRDYRGEPDALRADIEEIRRGDNEKLKRAIPAMEQALNPTPAMIEADKLFTDYFTQANDLNAQFKGTTSSIDPSRYSPRLFTLLSDAEETYKGFGGSKLSKRSPHDIRREYLHVLDPLKAGDVEARTFDAIDELRIYNDRLATSVANTVLQMELANTELGRHGIAGQVPPELKQVLGDTNILSPKELEELGGIPKDWVDLPGTGKTIVSNGKQFQVGFKVPPKVAEALRPMLEPLDPGSKLFKAAKVAQGFIKSLEVGLIPFHLRSMAFSFMNNAGMDAYWKAMATSNNSPEFESLERDGAMWGVTTTKTSRPVEAYQGLKPSSIADRGSMLKEAAKGAWSLVDKPLKGVTKGTFDVAQRKFKVIDFAIQKARWLAKHPNATDAEYGTAMRSIAKEVNAVYGGLNWDVMGVSANYQAWARFILLAPDWTFSNLASIKYAGQKGPGGSAARAYWVKSFTTAFAMSQGLSLFLNPTTNEDELKKRAMEHPFEVYLGPDANGKEMYTNIFLVGAPKDSVTYAKRVMKNGLVEGTADMLSYKLGPLVGTGVRVGFIKKDWQGRPITSSKDTALTKTGKELLFAGEQLIPAPFTIKDLASSLFDPNKDLTYKDVVAGMVGASVYHEGQKSKGVTLPGASSSRKGFHLKGAR